MTSVVYILRERQQNYFIFSCVLGSLKDQKQNKRSVQSMCVLTLYQGVLIFSPLKGTKSDQPKTTQTDFDLPRSHPTRKCILRERVSKLMHKAFPLLSTPFFYSFSLSFFTLFHSFLLLSTPFVLFQFPQYTTEEKNNNDFILVPSVHIILLCSSKSVLKRSRSVSSLSNEGSFDQKEE